MTARSRGRVKSGDPGKSVRFSRKRNPRECTTRRTINSGEVSCERTDRIARIRSLGFRLSNLGALFVVIREFKRGWHID